MKKTLQDQYLLIKEGKGHKGVFLTEVKRQFPDIVRNAATFDEAVASLKTKNIISENVFSVIPAIMDRPKKESYETAFEAFLAEARKAKENEDEKVKAEEKKVSKPVKKDLDHNFDYSDKKNPDNMIFDQIMMGYYAEMKDPKNADKTMQELKDIVFKNLVKDPIYYTKDGQFGIKDLGYTTEAPGLGTPKEAKGKYKSSGYGDLNEGVMYGDSDGDRDADMESTIQANEYYDKGLEAYNEGDKLKAEKYYQAALRAGSWLGWTENDLPPYDSLNEGMFSSKPLGDVEGAKKDIKKAIITFLKKNTNFKSAEELTDKELLKALEGFARHGKSETSSSGNRIANDLYKVAKPLFETDDTIEYYDGDDDEEVIDIRNMSWTKGYEKNESPEETKLREVIREIISEELDEILKINPVKGSGGRRVIPSDVTLSNDIIQKFNLSNPGPNAPAYDESIKIPHIVVRTSKATNLPSLFISDFLDMSLKGITRGRTTRETEVAKNTLQKMQGDITDKDWSMIRAFIKKFSDAKPTDIPVGGKLIKYHEIKFPSDASILGDEYETGFSLNKIDNGLKINLPKKKEGIKENTIESLRESVEKEIAEINKMAEYEVLESKLQKLADAVEKRQSQLSKLDEDEDMKALTDKKKIKDLQKDIKTLEKAKAKLEKVMSKHKGKVKKTEVIDEVEDEYDVNPAYEKDADERQDKGQSIDSIVSTYTNMPSDESDDLETYLEDREDNY